jgi:lysophospholipid acyltransferase (LPLAT)-like uncharacterized protein
MVESRRKKKFRWVRDLGKLLAPVLIPPIYNSYMWLVFYTSKKAYIGLPELWDMTSRGENVITAVWHQDAFIGTFVFRGRDVLTMVSKSDFGDILAEIMQKCHLIPVRGGSGNYGREALAEMIEYLEARRGVFCGIAVDGSRGPARQVQPGIVIMAQETGKPIYPMRVWARWRLFAPTWDRTLIPLPFNHLVCMVGEPIHISPDADRETLDAHREELKDSLDMLVERSENFFRKGTKEFEELRAKA